MSRSFTAASSHHLTGASPVSGVPFAVHCWFQQASAADGMLLSINLSSSATTQWGINLSSSAVSFLVRSGGGFNIATTSTTYSTGVWNSALGIAEDAGGGTSGERRRVFLNAGGKGTNNGSIADFTPDTLDVGRLGDSSPSNYVTALIAEVAVWDLSVWPGANNEAKADAFEAVAPAILAAGYAATSLPLGLVYYAPLIGRATSEPDFVGGNLLTVSGAAQAAHPRIILPSRPRLIVPVAAPPGGGTMLPLITNKLGNRMALIGGRQI